MPRSSRKTNKQIPAVSVRNLTVGYGGKSVIENLSTDILAGSVTAIIGPNGSGKSTLMKSMLGLIPPTEGTVEILGRHPHDAREIIGYVPQQFAFDRSFPITVREFIELAADSTCTFDHVQQKIKEVGLLPSVLTKLIGTLSGGQLQRVLIAQAILRSPSVLFMDEPSAGIDVAGEALLYDVIQHLNQEHGTTVVMISHDLSVLSTVVDNVLCVNRKLLCEGPPKSALSKKEVANLYGFDARVFESHTH